MDLKYGKIKIIIQEVKQLKMKKKNHIQIILLLMESIMDTLK